MTGRALYDKLCMEWSRRYSWDRSSSEVSMFPDVLRHWSALTEGEKTTFNRIAAKLYGGRR